MLKHTLRIMLFSALVVAVARPGAAQSGASSSDSMEEEPILDACSGPEHRQFDFWIGHWEVTDTAGKVVGTNEITRVANGCALNEYWRSARGPTGTSLNFYDPATGQWHQYWAGLGSFLRLSGGIEVGEMVLSGKRSTSSGPVIDRVAWSREEGGAVRQVWTVSRDGGESWQTVFNGLYRKR